MQLASAPVHEEPQETGSDTFDEISNDVIETDTISFEDEHNNFNTVGVDDIDIDSLEDVNVSMSQNVQPKAPSAQAVAANLPLYVFSQKRLFNQNPLQTMISI